MTAMLLFDASMLGALEEYAATYGRVTIARRRNVWNGPQPHLCLLSTYNDPFDDEPHVSWLALARPGNRVSTFERLVECERLRRVEPPIPLSQLRSALSARHRSLVDSTGRDILPEVGGREVVKSLLMLRPRLASVIEELTDTADVTPPVGAAGELLAFERDATATLLDIAKLKRRVLRRWRPEPTAALFLAGVPDLRVHEDAFIEHDAERFAFWARVPCRQLAWKVFADGQRHMFVMSASNRKTEETLGVDLMYYHEERKAFILVQYKKMRQDSEKRWFYWPDGELNSQLTRMRAVDDRCAAQAYGAYRLLATPCFIKLCETQALNIEQDQLLPGMYLPRLYFENLLADPSRRGSRGGNPIGYENVDPYLTNTLFIRLVREGLIGSTSAGPDAVTEQIRLSLDAGHSVVFGAHRGRRIRHSRSS